ncbi:MAG: hypothetical protein ACI4KN_04015 [Gemmiger sp.]
MWIVSALVGFDCSAYYKAYYNKVKSQRSGYLDYPDPRRWPSFCARCLFCRLFSLSGCLFRLPLLGGLLRQLFAAVQCCTGGRFRQRGNRIYGAFLPVRGILILAVVAIFGQKLTCPLAGAQPDGAHRGARDAGPICRVDRIVCRLLFGFYHLVSLLFMDWPNIV